MKYNTRYSRDSLMKNIGFIIVLWLVGCASVDATGLDVEDSAHPDGLRQGPTGIQVSRVYREKPGPSITWRDILTMTDIGDVAVSPDGRRVAFFSRRVDEACNCYAQAVHLYDFETRSVTKIANPGQPFVSVLQNGLINGGLMPPDLQWSPDGRYLAFVANTDGEPVLNRYDIVAMRTRELSTNGDPVYGFVWVPTSNHIVYQTGEPQPEVLRWHIRGLESGFLYGADYVDSWAEPIPLIPQIPVRVSNEIHRSSRAAVSVLKRVSVHSEITPAESDDSSLFAKYGGSSTYGADHDVIIRPEDEAKIAIEATEDGERVQRIIVLKAGERRPVSCGSICETHVCKIFPPEPEGHHTVMRISLGRILLTRFNLRGTAEGFKEEIIAEFAFPKVGTGHMGPICDAAGDALVCVVEEPNEPPLLAKIDARGNIEKLFDPNKGLRSRHYGRVDRLEIESSFGVSTYANLHYPTSYEEGRRYPFVVVQYRAGGFARGGTGNENPVLAYAEAGFFVLNYDMASIVHRTETSAEKAISRFNTRQPINKEALESITDYLENAGLVDKDLVAYTGLSAGANLINYVLAKGGHLKVAIISSCCTNPDIASINPFKFVKGREKAFPPDGLEFISPVPHVEKIETAILANVAEHETVYAFRPMLAGMRKSGKPMEVYIHADEYHIKTKPSHRAAIYRRNIQWLKFWLQDEEVDDPLDPEQYVRWREMREIHRASLNKKVTAAAE